MKIIPSIDLVGSRLIEFATACGETLARAHARSGDPQAISSYMGKGPQFATGMTEFSRRYAEQNERDHVQLVKAIADKTVESMPR